MKNFVVFCGIQQISQFFTVDGKFRVSAHAAINVFPCSPFVHSQPSNQPYMPSCLHAPVCPIAHPPYPTILSQLSMPNHSSSCPHQPSNYSCLLPAVHQAVHLSQKRTFFHTDFHSLPSTPSLLSSHQLKSVYPKGILF